MPLGPTVRRRLGRLEQPAATLYRRLFFNVVDFAERVRMFAPDRHRILEIGCGDGEVATALVAAYPDAEYQGIDVADDPGRRYRGPVGRAEFATMPSTRLAATEPGKYDMVVIADVLHHVPDDDDRLQILNDAAAMLAPGGVLVIKEWERQASLPYWAGWAADYFVSGDRSVRYMRRGDLMDMINQISRHNGRVRHVITTAGRPWACNVIYLARFVSDE